MPAFEGMAIEDIGVDDVQRLFNGMNTSKETKNKVKRLLNQVLNAATDDDLLMKNPLKSNRIEITGTESTTTETYGVEQMQYLVQHRRHQTGAGSCVYGYTSAASTTA